MQLARKYLQEHIFTRQTVLSKMDLASSVCNLKAYMVLHRVEKESEDPVHDYGIDSTLPPHKWRIRHADKLSNLYTNSILLIHHYVTVNGKCIVFEDIVKFTTILFEVFGLDEVAARRSVDIALTLDGSNLTKHLSFFMAGIKLVDFMLKNPLTGNYDLDPNQQDEKNFRPQSRRWSFPFKFCMGK